MTDLLTEQSIKNPKSKIDNPQPVRLDPLESGLSALEEEPPAEETPGLNRSDSPNSAHLVANSSPLLSEERADRGGAGGGVAMSVICFHLDLKRWQMGKGNSTGHRSCVIA